MAFFIELRAREKVLQKRCPEFFFFVKRGGNIGDEIVAKEMYKDLCRLEGFQLFTWWFFFFFFLV
jgi:hypothetical protein